MLPDRTKIGGKCQNWKIPIETFWVIFEHSKIGCFLKTEDCGQTVLPDSILIGQK